jgi:hypothetical protein
MADPTTTAPASPAARPLLPTLFALLAAHRPAFRQDRPFGRCLALVLGWLCGCGRHTITQALVALGLGGTDWSGFSRLFAQPRLADDRLTACLLGQTLPLAPATGPYLVALDGTQIGRHSKRMPGTSWLPHPGTAVFKRGLHRAQRFLHLAWRPLPSPAGYSRAVPLRFAPAFPAKAIAVAAHPPRTEWAAGLTGLGWVRGELDAADRGGQRVLAVADAPHGNTQTWAGLPAGVDLLTRCRRDRALFALPPPYAGKGRHRLYGDRARRPHEWLAARGGWRRTDLAVRGRTIPITYRVEGPYLIKGAAACPLFLLVVKGIDQHAHRKRRRDPSFWLVSAAANGDGGWRLPWPAPDLLAWAWQRWEIEVAHRELKTGFGLGEPQAWGPPSAVLTVQWTAWAYAVVVLAGLTAWGLGRGPLRPPGRWWGGSGRWSLARLWQGLRQELWGEAAFRRVWAGTGGDWWETADWLAAKTNAALAATRT